MKARLTLRPAAVLRTLCLAAAIVAVCACDKVELPSAEEAEDDITPSIDPTVTDAADTLSVEQAIAVQTDTIALVRGYIVGYVDGKSISAAVFGCPESGANTNMLIADTPTETSTTLCLPVALESGGALMLRESINLYDHPAYLYRRILLKGTLQTYFRQRGMKKVTAYAWISSDTTVTPTPSPVDASVTIGVSDTPTTIPSGR